MTLNEWLELEGGDPLTGREKVCGVSVYARQGHPARERLRKLDDFRVVTENEVVVWLVPKAREEAVRA